MADPTKYTRQTDYTPAELADLRSDLNPEFDALVVSSGEIVEAIKDVRASDGGLVNGIVDFDALDSDTQDKVNNAATEAANAKASADAAAASASDAADSASDAAASETAAKTSEDLAETAEVEAGNHAADAAVDADRAVAAAGSALDYRDAAEAASASAANAVLKRPNDDATTVFVDGRDMGSVAISQPFSNEEIAGVRVDLSQGTSSIDLGGIV